MRCRTFVIATLAFGVIGLVVATIYSAEITDHAAEIILGNAVPPSDNEFPLTPHVQRLSASEWAAIGGQGKGLNCSIPPLVEWLAFRRGGGGRSVSLQYRQACAAHDLCYRHGAATYGYTQADCDLMLIRAAFRLCRRTSGRDPGSRRCINAARKVYAGVFAGGTMAFRGERSPGGLDEASTAVEFEAFPAGAARYSVPRLVRNGPGEASLASLYFFLQRPGGSIYSRYDWRDGRFERVGGRGALPGRYESLPSPPFVISSPDLARGGDMFLWWRRSAKSSASTGGTVELSNGVDLASLPPLPLGRDIDPGGTQFFPVAGDSPDGSLHLVGISELDSGESGWSGCGVGAGVQIVHLAIKPGWPADANRTPAFRCSVFSIQRARGAEGRPGEIVGSYLATPPAAAFDGNAIRVRLYRRADQDDSIRYASHVQVLDARVPLDDQRAGDGRFRRIDATRHCWLLPETAEPVLELGGVRPVLAGFSYLVGSETVEPDARRDAAPSLLLYSSAGPADGGCAARDPGVVGLGTALRPFLQGRIIQLRFGRGGLAPDPRGMNDLVVLAAHSPERFQGDAFAVRTAAVLMWFREGQFMGCDRVDLGLQPESARSLQDQRRLAPELRLPAAIRRSGLLVTLAGDLNRDGVPDLVIANPENGILSTAFTGVRLRSGRLAFRDAAGLRRPATARECVAPANGS